MSPERHAQIEQIIEAAAELHGTERDAYLDRVCTGDAVNRQITP
jgi:hypothetical protein